jgi:hypothetical protein
MDIWGEIQSKNEKFVQALPHPRIIYVRRECLSYHRPASVGSSELILRPDWLILLTHFVHLLFCLVDGCSDRNIVDSEVYSFTRLYDFTTSRFTTSLSF